MGLLASPNDYESAEANGSENHSDPDPASDGSEHAAPDAVEDSETSDSLYDEDQFGGNGPSDAGDTEFVSGPSIRTLRELENGTPIQQENARALAHGEGAIKKLSHGSEDTGRVSQNSAARAPVSGAYEDLTQDRQEPFEEPAPSDPAPTCNICGKTGKAFFIRLKRRMGKPESRESYCGLCHTRSFALRMSKNRLKGLAGTKEELLKRFKKSFEKADHPDQEKEDVLREGKLLHGLNIRPNCVNESMLMTRSCGDLRGRMEQATRQAWAPTAQSETVLERFRTCTRLR